MVSRRDNLLRVLHRQTPEWVPCTAHIANANNLPGQLPVELLREPLDRLAISRYVGPDVLYEISPISVRHSDNIRIQRRQEGDLVTEVTETPVGTLKSVMKRAAVPSPRYPDMRPEWAYPPPIVNRVYVEHPVKSVADYRTVRFLYENMSYETDGGAIRKALEAVGQDGVVVIGGGPSSPLYALVANLAGLERTVFDLADNPLEVQATMEVLTARSAEWYRKAAASEAQVLRASDDGDTSLISPDWFAKYAVPALRQYAEISHTRDKVLVLHACGRVRGLLSLIKQTGIDAHHCLCPPETGNTPLGLARSVYGRDVTIMARIDPPVLVLGTPEQLEAKVRQMLAEVAPADSFMFIVPCGRAPLRNLRAVFETVEATGAFPVPARSPS